MRGPRSHLTVAPAHPCGVPEVGPGLDLSRVRQEWPRLTGVGAENSVTVPEQHLPRGRPSATRQVLGSALQACVSIEFTKLQVGVPSPVVDWLRSLARELHAELGAGEWLR